MVHSLENRPPNDRSGEPRTALVTGGTSGIGLACARRLQADGLRVAVLDLDRPEARKVASQHGLGFVATDLSRRADTVEAVGAAVTLLGGIDVLVNNAGFQHIEPISSFPEDTWDAMLHVMLTAPFLLIKHAWPFLIRSGQGRVVNIASIHAQVASPYKAAYVSAKHGLIGLTRTAALEGAEHGLTVNALCPAYVRTPLVERQIADQARTRGISESYGFRLIRYLGPPVEASQGFDPVALSLQPAALCGERHLEVRQRLKMSVFQRRIRQLP